MKICIIGPHYPVMPYPCGAADFIKNLAFGLNELGNNVWVINSNPGAERSSSGPNVLSILGNWGPIHVIKTFKQILRIRPDVVDIQYEEYMFGGKGIILLLPIIVKIFIPKTRVVLTLHSMGLPKVGGRIWRLFQLTLFDKVIFYSKNLADQYSNKNYFNSAKYFAQGFPSNITVKKVSGLDTFLAKAKTKYFDDQPLGIYFGHINNNRGIEDIIKAISEIRAINKSFKFIFIGQFDPQSNHYHRDIMAMVKQLGLENLISFSGRLNEQEVSHIFQSADFSILPFVEGASFKNGSLAASIIHQVPIVTTKSELTEEKLLNCKGIIFYTNKDLSDLQNKIIQVIDQKFDKNTARSDLYKLSEVYSWDEYIKKRLEIYTK